MLFALNFDGRLHIDLQKLSMSNVCIIAEQVFLAITQHSTKKSG